MELESIPFSLRECTGRTAQTLAVRARREQGLELACHVSPDIPDALIGDPGRLRQILINLIGNAIKFTPEGEVVIEVMRASANSAFHAKNDLPVVAPEAIELLFSVRIPASAFRRTNRRRCWRRSLRLTARRLGDMGEPA